MKQKTATAIAEIVTNRLLAGMETPQF